jgi:hypothetical protein
MEHGNKGSLEEQMNAIPHILFDVWRRMANRFWLNGARAPDI